MKTLKPKKPDRRPAGDHSYADLYNKAEAALRNPEFIKIAILADSPNAAETAGRSQGLHWHIRRMIHALARIKRDYPKQFWNMDEINEAFHSLPETLWQDMLVKMIESGKY